MSWRPLEPSTPYRNGVPVDLPEGEEQFSNDLFVVTRRILKAVGDPEQSDMIYLSIRNQDRSVRHDWRHFQRIKNQLAGPEWEAVEIYPAESRLVDGANQYHLWCFDFRLPFGFNRRLVGNQYQADIASPGAVQRDPEKVDLQYGGLTKLKDMLEEFPYKNQSEEDA